MAPFVPTWPGLARNFFQPQFNLYERSSIGGLPQLSKSDAIDTWGQKNFDVMTNGLQKRSNESFSEN